jgi:phage tail sheath protein FI
MRNAAHKPFLQRVWWRRLSVMVTKELRQLFRDAALIGFFFWAFVMDVYLVCNSSMPGWSFTIRTIVPHPVN